MIILASKSPRRITLLKKIFPSFEIMPADIDEYLYPEDQLSLVKAKAISSSFPSALIFSIYFVSITVFPSSLPKSCNVPFHKYFTVPSG